MTTTPNGARVYAYMTDGDGANITESVRVAYDIVIQSLDWGSGFLDHEEEHRIYDLGKILGFELPHMKCFYRQVEYPDGECSYVGRGIKCRGTKGHWHSVDTGECTVKGTPDG